MQTGVNCGEEFTSDAQFLSAEVGFVIASKCGDVGHLLGTADGGETWSSLYPPPFLENCSTPELRSRPSRELCSVSTP
jgi:hypothetical protein